MSVSYLTNDNIDLLVESYKTTEVTKKIDPVTERKDKYVNLSDGYNTLSTRLNSFHDLLDDLRETGTSSIFQEKATTTTDEAFVTAKANSSAIPSSYNIRTSQLAKNDIAFSADVNSQDSYALTGKHTFQIKTGDGEGGEFTSNIEVEFDFEDDDYNKTAYEQIAWAINKDKAIVETASMVATDTFTGTGSFVIDINGEETTLDYDYTNTSYDAIVEDLVSKISSDVDGVSVEKVVDGGNVSLKLTVDDNNNYITIDQTTDTGSLLSAGNFDVNVMKEKSGAGTLIASAFSPTTTTSQISITAKETGTGYRIKELNDTNGGGVLASLGLNLGAGRPQFDQSTAPDTSGFMYVDINEDTTELNSKFTLNGINVNRSTNVISDLVTGVTFTLNATMEADDNAATIAVTNDTEDIKGKLEEFIESYNSVYKYIKQNSSYSGSSASNFFAGDSNSSAIIGSLRTSAYSVVEGIPSGNLNKLSDIGITFDPYTGLEIDDESLLEQKISDNVNQVEAIFNSANGIAGSLYDRFESYLGIGGYLEQQKSSYDKTVKNLKDKIEDTQQSIDDSADVLRSKYEQMQQQLVELMLNSQTFSQFTGGGGGVF